MAASRRTFRPFPAIPLPTPSLLLAALLLGAAPALAQDPAPDAVPAKPPAVQPAISSGLRATRDAAVVIGVEAYEQLPQATFARADARAWADWLEVNQGVRDSRITTLEDPDRDDLYAALRKAGSRVRRKGTLWVVFAGHGAMTAGSGGQRTLLTREADAMALGSDGMTLDDATTQLMRRRRASRVVWIVDAAFDGRGRDGLELVPGTRFLVPDTEPVTDDDRVVVWAASASDGPVDSWIDAGHGTFTWSALGALRGWADGELDGNPDGRVTLDEAQAYVAWTGRQLGRPVKPGLLGDPSHGELVLGSGAWLETGPDAALLEQLSMERRRRRFQDVENLLRAEAAAFWQATLQAARTGGPEGRQALEAFVDEFANKEITLSWTVALPEVREARQLLGRYDDAQRMVDAVMVQPPATVTDPAVDPDAAAQQAAQLAAQQAAQRQAAEDAARQAALEQVEAVAQAVEEASCDDLVALEVQAMDGRLSAGQLACLDLRVRTDRLQTDREKASILLIANALIKKDQARWASLVKRHLAEISRADPTMVMHYAVYLYRADPIEYGEDAIHWAEVALENKQRWEGDAYIDNVGALYRVRAEAAYKLWIHADRAYRAAPDEDAEWQAEEYRGWTKDFAREWLDYVRAAGRDPQLAMEICTSAAGTVDFCRER